MDSKKLGGAALVVSFAIGTILAIFEVQDWTMASWLAWSLVIALLAAGGIAVVILLDELRKVGLIAARRFEVRWPVVRRRIQKSASPAENYAPQEPSVFDPYTIVTNLAGVDLSGLSEPESFMLITLNVRNVSGYPVKITGVKGRIRCAGAECNMPAPVEREPRQLRPSSSDGVPCTIRQPLGQGMMHTVSLPGNSLGISLSGVQWVGSVDLPGGSAPLEGCYLHEDFVVRGPFREKRDGSTLFRLTTTFLSSEHYDSDGTPKQDDSSATPQSA